MVTQEIYLFRDIRPEMFKWTTSMATKEHGSIGKIDVGRENLIKNVKVIVLRCLRLPLQFFL